MFLFAILFIFLFGALVLVHEWGHFIVARKLGVRVEEFAFGFPPRLASVTRRGTRYALNLFPIGGYVKIFGESGESAASPESFGSRPIWQRVFIIGAGAAMNFVLAWALFSAGHGLGLPTIVDEGQEAEDVRVTVIGVAPGSPADVAGIQLGDAVTGFRTEGIGAPVATVGAVQEFVAVHRGETVIVEILRGKDNIERAIAARREPPEGEGPLGIAMAETGIVRSPWWRAPWDGFKTTVSAVLAIAQALGQVIGDLFREGRVSRDVMGPVGIVSFVADTRGLGIVYLLELVAVLSVNLAVINVLPIPALDGGRLAFLFVERIRGAHMNSRFEQVTHTAGFVVLLLLMAAITYRDVARIL